MTDAADPSDVDAPRPRPRRATATVVAAALAVVFFASAVLLAVVAAGLKADKDDLLDGRAEVASTAGRFVQALLSYDHRDAEGYRQRVLALTAPPFTAQFEDAVRELQEDFDDFDSVSIPTIDDVFVTEVADAEASAIVAYDRVLDGTGGQRRESNLYVRLGLIERDGGWRINDVVNLNLAIASSSGDAPAPPTTGSPAAPSG